MSQIVVSNDKVIVNGKEISLTELKQITKAVKAERAKLDISKLKIRKTWDKGINNTETKTKIVKLMNEYRAVLYPGSRQKLACCIGAMISLFNATRIGETTEAFYRFMMTGNREIEVRIEKHLGRRKSPTIEVKTVWIPPEITDEDRKAVMRCWDYKAETWPRLEAYKSPIYQAFKYFINRYIGTNTHSLRYAGNTEIMDELVARGENPFEAMHVTGHKSPAMAIHYLQSKKSKEFMRGRMVRESEQMSGVKTDSTQNKPNTPNELPTTS